MDGTFIIAGPRPVDFCVAVECAGDEDDDPTFMCTLSVVNVGGVLSVIEDFGEDFAVGS